MKSELAASGNNYAGMLSVVDFTFLSVTVTDFITW